MAEQITRERPDALLIERVAQLIAHRACCGTEHDPANGKLHGYCVVCGVPWPCEYAGKPPAVHAPEPPGCPTPGAAWDGAERRKGEQVAEGYEGDADVQPLYARPPATGAVVPDGWIAVSERLPSDSKPVLVQAYQEDADWQDVAWYNGVTWFSNVSGRSYTPKQRITHWQALPAAPTKAGR